jgi:hypothetical protein
LHLLDHGKDDGRDLWTRKRATLNDDISFQKLMRWTDSVIGDYIGFWKDVRIAHLVKVPYEWTGSVRKCQRI